jgi:hypothetical protein
MLLIKMKAKKENEKRRKEQHQAWYGRNENVTPHGISTTFISFLSYFCVR